MQTQSPTTCHTFHAQGGTLVTLQLEGSVATDDYATNLELTGQAHWFGSMNLSNLIADGCLFDTCHFERSEQFPLQGNPSDLHVLELGSGTGRAGIMAAKMMEIQHCSVRSRCLLTDGEPMLVEISRRNVRRNGLQDNAECQQLQWGENPQLEHLRRKFEFELFDVILGADLVYGPDALTAASDLMHTVNSLLAKSGEFFLAFTRRDTISIEDLCLVAAKFNLVARIHEDYTFDIFDNNVDSSSMFWRDAILIFTHIRQADLPTE